MALEISQGLIGKVVVGDHDITWADGKEQAVSIMSLMSHPNYNSDNFANDICVIKKSFILTL